MDKLGRDIGRGKHIPQLEIHLTLDQRHTLFFSNFYSFIYILAALGLRCCVWAFSSCRKRGLLFVAVHRLLIAMASLVAEHGL